MKYYYTIFILIALSCLYILPSNAAQFKILQPFRLHKRVESPDRFRYGDHTKARQFDSDAIDFFVKNGNHTAIYTPTTTDEHGNVIAHRVRYILTTAGRIYEIGRFLGRGTFGFVNAGRDVLSNERVAIKRSNSKMLSHLMKELEIMISLPESLKMYKGHTIQKKDPTTDADGDCFDLYIAMELITSDLPLSKWIGMQAEHMTPNQLQWILASVIRFYSENVWSLGVRHGDMRVPNILVESLHPLHKYPKNYRIIDFSHTRLFNGSLPLEERYKDVQFFMSQTYEWYGQHNLWRGTNLQELLQRHYILLFEKVHQFVKELYDKEMANGIPVNENGAEKEEQKEKKEEDAVHNGLFDERV